MAWKIHLVYNFAKIYEMNGLNYQIDASLNGTSNSLIESLLYGVKIALDILPIWSTICGLVTQIIIMQIFEMKQSAKKKKICVFAYQPLHVVF